MFVFFFLQFKIILVLPDSTATDLDQHLSNLVGSTTGQMTHPSLLTGASQSSITTTTNGSSNSILVPRYHSNSNNDYNVHSSQNGPRSLSDSSQTESPVQDDLLTSNTPNLGGGGGNNGSGGGNGGIIANNQNFSGIVVNQGQNSYSSSSTGCNGSLYPVLPASLLYSQLYTAANQSHGFHSHSLPPHASPNSSVHGELQSVMDHISTVGVRQQHNIMSGGGGIVGGNGTHHHHGDLTTLVGNCGTSARNVEDGSSNRQVAALAGHRGHHSQTDNGNSVWRPY